MKTSNKLLVGTGIGIILGIFSYAFVMRGAYQKALANPLANELRIDLKAMKYLNISYDNHITFKHGNKYEIVINKGENDSLKIDYQGDMINLSVGNIRNVIIYCPKLPVMSFTKKDVLNKQEIGEAVVDSSFQSGEFMVASLKNVNVEFRKCHFDKVDIQSKNKSAISMENCEVKLFNLSLPKNSELNLSYSNILSKNIVLGDSCSVVIVGNQSLFLK